MKLRFGIRFSSVVLGLMVLGFMAPAALRAQSDQNPSNSSNSQSNSQTTPTKKSKKSKSSSTSDTGGTSGSTAGGGTAGGTASSSSKSAAPSVTQSAATADQHAPNNNRTSAMGKTPPSPGMVWVNTSTKVYHKQGSKYYGNTKQGKWMTEGDAAKAGYKAASN